MPKPPPKKEEGNKRKEGGGGPVKTTHPKGKHGERKEEKERENGEWGCPPEGTNHSKKMKRK